MNSLNLVKGISKYQLYGRDTVFFLWNWFWVENSSATLSVTSSPHRSPTPNDSSSSSSSDEIPAITHTVVFKCIGVTKEKKYLKYAKKRLDDDGFKLPVKFQRYTKLLIMERY